MHLAKVMPKPADKEIAKITKDWLPISISRKMLNPATTTVPCHSYLKTPQQRSGFIHAKVYRIL